MKIDLVALDADDTLWHMESLFHMTHEKFTDLLSAYHTPQWIEKKLFETEMNNLKHFGYGVKGFTLSMIETAIQLTEGRIKGSEIETIIDFGKQMLQAPVKLLKYAENTVKTLAASFPLMLLTKGDLFDQESKIARSGLSRYFDHIEICSHKNTAAYTAILKNQGIPPNRFLMVGNSLKSDILPVLELGGHAVFIPYEYCWEHEKIESPQELPEKYPNFHQLEHIGQLPGVLFDLATTDARNTYGDEDL